MKLQLFVIAGVCLGAALAKEVNFSGNIKCCVVEPKRPVDNVGDVGDLPIGEGVIYEGGKGGQKGQQQQQQSQHHYGDIKETQVRRKRQWGGEYGTVKGGQGKGQQTQQQQQQQQQQQWKEVRTFGDYDTVKGGQKKGQQTQQQQEHIPEVQIVDHGVKGGQGKGQQTQQQQQQQKGTPQEQQSGRWGDEYGTSGSNGKGQQTQQQQQQQQQQQIRKQNRNKRNTNEYCTAPLTWIVDLYDRFPLGVDEHLTTITGTGGNFKVDYSGSRVFGIDPKIKVTAHCDGYSRTETLEVAHGEHNINIVARPEH